MSFSILSMFTREAISKMFKPYDDKYKEKLSEEMWEKYKEELEDEFYNVLYPKMVNVEKRLEEERVYFLDRIELLENRIKNLKKG